MPEHRSTIAALQNQSFERGLLNVWTVYDHPRDFPHSYVARRFEVSGSGPVVTDDIIQGELSIIRKSFRECGLTCLPRSDDDEPQIVECWL